MVDINKLTKEKEELAIQILKDENAKMKTQLRSSKRVNALFGMLKDEIQNFCPVLPTYKPKVYRSKPGVIKESALLILSDAHCDMIVDPKRVQGFESYNFHVACKRAERIVDTTITHLKDNLNNYQFDELYIFFMGDLTSGEIHDVKMHTEWNNALKSCLYASELFARMIVDMAKHFKKIHIVSVPGNHGRRTQKKDYRGAHDNWDYLTMRTVEIRLQNYIQDGRITMVIPNSFSTGVQIQGWNFLITHGDDVRSWNSIPWYGIERRTRRLSALGAVKGITPHYHCFAHFHTESSKQHPTGETIINGAWYATDEYVLEKMAEYKNPVQFLAGVHPKYGLTWRMPIYLRTPDWLKDEKGVTRYSIGVEYHEL